MLPATTSPTTPLADCFAHLYTPEAFAPPPGAGPVPVSPQDWVSFNALEASGPTSFDEFRESPLFDLARHQLLDRLEDCERFARTHCSPSETSAILEGMASMRDRLQNLAVAEQFYGTAMSQLFGSGKRSFDAFCLRLQQSDLDLHQRKTALRELAQQLPFCGSAGPAFRQAALALDQAPGGLRAEFYQQLMLRLDSLLKEFVCMAPATGETPEARQDRQHWLRSMEVHMVNHLKLELDLPGADPTDRFARSATLITPEQRTECSNMLRRQLRPVVVAKDLAERYQGRLRAALPAGLQSDDAGLDDIMAEISEANTQLNATFGPVPLHHVLEHDERAGRTQWREDLSLIALDLLQELERQSLIVPRPPTRLMTAASDSCEWDLLHIDWRLFVVMERFSPKAAATPAAAQLSHALQWRSMRTFESPRSELTRTVLAAESPDRLLALPHDWLKDAAQCEAFLRRIGEDRALRWLRSVPRGASPLPVLLPALTALGMAKALEMLRHRNEKIRFSDWVSLAGGYEILQRALIQPEERVFQAWSHSVSQTFLTITKEQANQLFSPSGLPSLVDTALRTASADRLDRLLRMLFTLRVSRVISNADLLGHLKAQIQLAMFHGRLTPLQTLARRLEEMARYRWLNSADLRLLMEGPIQGMGCTAALENGHAEVVRWFHLFVTALRQKGYLALKHATALVGSEPSQGLPGALLAIYRREAAALQEHFAGLLRHFTEVPSHAEVLLPLMACQGPEARNGVRVMLHDDSLHPCLEVWKEAVLQAHQRQLMSAADVGHLISAKDANGVPYIRDVLNQYPKQIGAKRWLETVAFFHQRQAIGAAEVNLLMEALTPPEAHGVHPMLHAAMGVWRDPAAPERLARLYSWACELKIIGVERMVDLLMAKRRSDPPLSGLAVAVASNRHETVASYLATIVEIAAHHKLPPETLLQLLDSRSEGSPSMLTLAVQLNKPTTVKMLLLASLKAAERGLLPADTWCSLMMPADGHLGAIDVLDQCSDLEVHAAFSDALQHAKMAGILDSRFGRALVSLWTNARRNPTTPTPATSPAANGAEAPASSWSPSSPSTSAPP